MSMPRIFYLLNFVFNHETFFSCKVFKSLEAGAWLKEEDFEMDKEMPVVKVNMHSFHKGFRDAKSPDFFCCFLFKETG